ncbi:MAG: type II toxin-antitoxin system RelE/ParE family toxin [Mycobacterium sp.]
MFYVTKFGDAMFVLHCLMKKSQKTAQKDVAIGTQRYSEARKQYEQERRARGCAFGMTSLTTPLKPRTSNPGRR